MPVISLGLGLWQIQRLKWKTDLIAEYESRLVLPPLPMPPLVNPDVVKDFQYRRVTATGKFRHDLEMLIGPRSLEGEDGYQVVTPLERENGSTLLVNRGWIAKKVAEKTKRIEGLPLDEVTVEGILRIPAGRHTFSPDNEVDKGLFFYVDLDQMAAKSGAQPVMIEQFFEYADSDVLASWQELVRLGIPIGRDMKVNIRNNHGQYIVTWFGVSLVTAIMLVVLRRRPASEGMLKQRHMRRYM
ncbi:SURF1 family-domain-containing protein [Dipodascopsis tothii]|uniref:SURF1 family-domain-containing protein n=1 Tax=Dipodascopsis tothii TaxID=44089 RepID=UPI0034CFCC56